MVIPNSLEVTRTFQPRLGERGLWKRGVWKDEWTGLPAAPERQEWEQVSVASLPPREAGLRWGFTEVPGRGTSEPLMK